MVRLSWLLGTEEDIVKSLFDMEPWINAYRSITGISGVIGAIAAVVGLYQWWIAGSTALVFAIGMAAVTSAGASATLIGIYDRLGVKP